MCEEKSELNTAFADMLENPHFDWGFEKEREATGLANFGVTAEKAAEIRKKYEDLELPAGNDVMSPEAVDSFHAQFERFDEDESYAYGVDWRLCD